MSEDSDRERLRQLEERIAAAKGAREAPRAKDDAHYSAAGLAWRMVTELVAGIGIGLLIGLGLDALFGTKPILMIVFLAFGFAAGIRVMMRTSQEVARSARTDDPAGPAGQARHDTPPGTPGDARDRPPGTPGDTQDRPPGDGPGDRKGG